MNVVNSVKAREREEVEVSEETAVYMTAPTTNGDRPLPRRDGPRGLLPSTWISRTLRLEYVSGAGEPQSTSATLLDVYPFGPVLNIRGAKTLLSWDSLVLVELVEDR